MREMGEIVRSVGQVQAGTALTITVTDGDVGAVAE